MAHEKSVYQELITLEVADEKITGTKDVVKFLENIRDRLKQKSDFKGSNYDIINGNTLAITTKEGYKFAVVEDRVMLIEDDDGKIPEIREGELQCKTTPSYWINTDVSLEITSPKHPLWNIEYSENLEDSTSWRDYNGKMSISDNKTIYARLRNNAGASENYATHTINNIDKIPPQLTAGSFKTVDGIVNTRGFTLALEVQDVNSGLSQIIWNYKLKSDRSWKKSVTDVYHELHTKNSGSTELETKTHIFDKLSKGTYVVQANIYDVAGNITTTEEITIPVGDINERVEEAGVGSASISPKVWTNGDVTVTLPTVTDIETRYTIDGTTPTISSTEYLEPFTVSGNCSIQYIFTDGYNITDAKAAAVTNIDKVLPTIVSDLAEDSKKITNVSTTITVEDTASGLGQIEWYYKSETDTEWRSETDVYKELHSATAGEKKSVTQTHTFNGLKSNTKYVFYAVVYDVAGNTVQSGSPENPLNIQTYNVAEFSPNENIDWKKEHSTTVTISDLADKVVSAKYCWTNSTSQPAESQFTTTFTPGNAISKNGVTGTYYAWVLIEYDDGEKDYCRSNGFNFDNEGPNITAFTATKSSATAIALSATAQDNKSGAVKFEFYIDGTLQSSYTQTFTATISSVTKNVTITGLSTGSHTCMVKAYDAENNSNTSSTSGATKLYTWERWGITKTTTWEPYLTGAKKSINHRYDCKFYAELTTWNSVSGNYAKPTSYREAWRGLVPYVYFEDYGCCCIMVYSSEFNLNGPYFATFSNGEAKNGYSYYNVRLETIGKREGNPILSKGTTQYSDVTSTSSSAYPNGAASGSYWYVYKGVY